MIDDIRTWKEQVQVPVMLTFDLISFAGPRQQKDMDQLKASIAQFVRKLQENPQINVAITDEVKMGVTDDNNIGAIRAKITLT